MKPLIRIWLLIVLAALFQSRPTIARAFFAVRDLGHESNDPTMHKNESAVEMSKSAEVADGQQPDYFLNNTLETFFTDDRVTARLDSAVVDGNVLTISGVVTYRLVSVHANITDEADMADKTGSSALILQGKLDGDMFTLMWMKRSCACSTEAKFVVASANEGDEVWVAGSTTGIDNGVDNERGEGMALMRYNSRGEQLLLRQLGAAGEKYEWVGYTLNAANGSRDLTLVGSVNGERYEGLQNGLVAQIVNETGDVLQTTLVSKGENVVGETFWSAASMNEMLYVAGKRLVQTDLSPRSSLTLTKIDTEKMEQAATREFENELQRGMVVCTNAEGVTVSYVARNNNQGNIIVEEMDGELGSTMRSKTRIQRDMVFQKAERSSMAACDTMKNPPVLLMNTAEALNQTAPDWETKRKLNKQRPALLTVEDKEFRSISQSQRSIEWVASGMVRRGNSSNDWIIFGKTGTGKPLLSSGHLAERTSTAAAPSSSPIVTTMGNECIGEQTRIGGTNVEAIIRAHSAMRLQRHPLRRALQRGVLLGDALCRSAGGGDVLCATAQHVVRVGDETLFMGEWCARMRDCELRRQRLLNFKAPCDVTLPPAADGARLTMHSGHASSALAVVRAECRARSLSPLHRAWWWLSSL
ncbi:unnamed protein product [Agarophyton chilense]